MNDEHADGVHEYFIHTARLPTLLSFLPALPPPSASLSLLLLLMVMVTDFQLILEAQA